MSDVYNNLKLVFSLIIKPLKCSCNHVYSYHVHMYFIVMCFSCNCCLPLLNQFLLLIPHKQLNLLPFSLGVSTSVHNDRNLSTSTSCYSIVSKDPHLLPIVII